METELEGVGECGHGLTTVRPSGRHAVRIVGLLKRFHRGGYVQGSFLICSDCWHDSLNEHGTVDGDAPVNDQLNRFNYGKDNCVSGLYGG